MMSSLHKRPASPRHLPLYAPAAKRPRLSADGLQSTRSKRKYDQFCESCLNNQQAEKEYYTEQILHPERSWAVLGTDGRSRTVEPYPCRNFQNDSEVSVNGPRRAAEDYVSESYVRRHKRLRPNPEDKMQITIKDLLKPSPPVMEKTDVDPQFNSFNFWRPVLPDIDSQLDSLLEMDTEPTPIIEDEENPEFNSFNFWRVPLKDIDIDIDIL